VIGDSVNLASRLEGVNKEYGTLIIVAEDTWSRVRGSFEARELDWIRVKGKTRPVAIYELAAEAGGVSPARRALFDVYADGLAKYRAGAWTDAAAAFSRALEIEPADAPSRLFLDRSRDFAQHPPDTWDGVHVMRTK
jgi:adenylate cyclase